MITSILFRLTPPLLVGCVLAVTNSALAQEAGEAEKKVEEKVTPVPVEDGTATIGPKNTRIEFVGLHTGDDPRPRLGGFQEFEGTLVARDGRLEEIRVEIAIESVWTEFDRLTAHLKTADFFHAEEYPTATFQSTSIKPGTAGDVKITGTLDLHGTESEIEFPAKVHVNDKGLLLKSEFKLDRTAFGMDGHTDGVEKLVSVRVVVGQATRDAEDDSTAEEDREAK